MPPAPRPAYSQLNLVTNKSPDSPGRLSTLVDFTSFKIPLGGSQRLRGTLKHRHILLLACERGFLEEDCPLGSEVVSRRSLRCMASSWVSSHSPRVTRKHGP